MIQASKVMKDYIKAQKSVEAFAEEMNVTRQTIYNIIDGDNVSSVMVAKLLNKTGMDFEKAFEVEE